MNLVALVKPSSWYGWAGVRAAHEFPTHVDLGKPMYNVPFELRRQRYVILNWQNLVVR